MQTLIEHCIKNKSHFNYHRYKYKSQSWASAVDVLFSSVTLAIVNTYSSRLAARLAIITTVGKLGALITIIIGGIIAISQGKTTLAPQNVIICSKAHS